MMAEHNETSSLYRGESAGEHLTQSGRTTGQTKIVEVNTTSSTGATKCEPCAAGKFANAAGASTCQDCKPNFFSQHSASTTCMECPRGRYQVGTWMHGIRWMFHLILLL